MFPFEQYSLGTRSWKRESISVPARPVTRLQVAPDVVLVGDRVHALQGAKCLSRQKVFPRHRIPQQVFFRFFNGEYIAGVTLGNALAKLKLSAFFPPASTKCAWAYKLYFVATRVAYRHGSFWYLISTLMMKRLLFKKSLPLGKPSCPCEKKSCKATLHVQFHSQSSCSRTGHTLAKCPAKCNKFTMIILGKIAYKSLLDLPASRGIEHCREHRESGWQTNWQQRLKPWHHQRYPKVHVGVWSIWRTLSAELTCQWHLPP